LYFFFNVFCLDSDLSFLELIRFFTLTFQTLLGSFSQRTALDNLSPFQPRVPVVLRVQRYTLFLSLQHFFKLFFTFFELFLFWLIANVLYNEKYSNLCDFITFLRLFSPFLLRFRTNLNEKISQNPKIRRKTERF